MRKAVAIYHAPEGDNKVVEMGGVTFFDGQTVDLNSDDNAHLVSKLPGNQHFEFEAGEEEKPKRGPGRPPKVADDDKTDDEDPGAAADKADTKLPTVF